jgi:antitoxin (DNA-binding transcriptional repressor) of toxin-antitoxin stability system
MVEPLLDLKRLLGVCRHQRSGRVHGRAVARLEALLGVCRHQHSGRVHGRAVARLEATARRVTNGIFSRVSTAIVNSVQTLNDRTALAYPASSNHEPCHCTDDVTLKDRTGLSCPASSSIPD